VVLRRDWIAAHPAAARTFVEKSAKALDYARENLDDVKKVTAKVLATRNENPDIAQYFKGYGVRAGGLAVKRDVQFWIDVLVRDGKLQNGQLDADRILFDPTKIG
jgi:ABC-type nitrate/sulfonate/bicarbonate transport system substrate-binding protein